ncbi:glycosyltransferase family 2 protein [Alkalinema pantanalense CENA528]|uniref:glycosyltransferase family 2 protein n=1 Tax=Alkalinema pantanalense TaxID=1620705 RepID=UPI003D700325
MSPRIAAIVPSRNRRSKTLRFLKGLSQQTSVEVGIILVDANSSDGTPDAVFQEFPLISILHVDDDSYWTASTNRGVVKALEEGYDYILTINDDGVINSNYLETLIRMIQKHQLMILGSRHDYLDDPSLVASIGIGLDWNRHLVRILYADCPVQCLPAEVRNADILDVDTVTGNGTLFHRSVFDQVGLFDEKHMPHYYADSELVLRAKRRGMRVCVTPQAIIWEDTPTPSEQVLARQEESDRSLWEDFIYTFFHKKSGEMISAKLHFVLRHCPPQYKIQAILRRTIGAMGGWWVRRLRRQMQRVLSPSLNNAN